MALNSTLDDYQLSCELFGHSLDVRAVSAGAAIESNENDANDNCNQTIISGSRDKTVKIWKKEANEYMEMVTFQDHKNFVSAVYFFQSEQWICTGSNDCTICIYTTDSYVPILTLKGHESTVCAISEGIEARSIISGSWDKTARVWSIGELGTATSIVLRGHEAAVWAVGSMPSKQQFITGSADKCIFYWNAQGEKLRLLKGHTDCVRGLLTLPKCHLVSCANDAIIRYWNDDGECARELTGHTNYIYALAEVSNNVIVSCGEDSTLRMWDLLTGNELGSPIVHPAQSVWCVTALKNGDIVTGSSDGIVRVFTKDSRRLASESVRNAYKVAVDARIQQLNEELGGYKKTDLPGPEALLSMGTREGQTKIVRHADGSVKCYCWQEGTWNLVGDVTGASGGTQATSGKTLHEGKEYDFVFSVDISDTMPPLKLPYNRGEDPWVVAQAFIHKHNLPQAYLDQVSNFIITNAQNAGAAVAAATPAGFQDPFTGGSRYVPGGTNNNQHGTGNMDPFTGGSSYSTTDNSTKNQQANVKGGTYKHFPVNNYLTFDTCDAKKVLDKLIEFNNKVDNQQQKVSENTLQAFIKLADVNPKIDESTLLALPKLLSWPADLLFPVIDILRLVVRFENIFNKLNSLDFLAYLTPLISSNNSPANQLMVVRCLTNMMQHKSGCQEVEVRLALLIENLNNIKSGTANLQIAMSTFYLNLSISQTVRTTTNADYCRMITEGLIELLKWATDLEASYRLMLTIGNLLTTSFGQETSALIVSVDYVIDRIRELANTPQTGAFAKVNSVGTELLTAF